MLNETIQQAINKQITFEFAASHNYMAMAAYFEDRNLPGFAHWFHIQSNEEREHALRFFNYVNDRNGRVHLEAIPEPQSEFSSPLDALEQALAHEQRVTAAINTIYALAARESDFATMSMLQWFLDEQVEEEKSADDIIQQLKLIGNDGTGLLMIDHELAGRKGGGEGEAT